MNRDLAVFTKYEDKYVLMHFADDEVKHLYVYQEPDGLTLGTVINCRIDSQIENIDSCFVAYAPKSTGYLDKKYRNGEILPLMLKKEAIDNKKPLFTDVISIEGEYVVVSAGRSFVKVSSKIPAQEKDAYIQAFKEKADREGVGVIIRTAAYTDEDGIDKAKNEFDSIVIKLKEIPEKSEHAPQYCTLYSPLPAYISDIMYLIKSGIKEVVTDDPAVFESLHKEYSAVTEPVKLTDRVGIRFYEDKMLELSKLYSFGGRISECLKRKVYLKSGASITIDQTEALTAIDVNTASNAGKTLKNYTFLAVNIEAADEIARQLVLRNIGGMIIIDFINMDLESDYDELKNHLIKVLKSDREYCRFIDFTGLKLCELTRSRRGKSLYQSLRSR